MDWTALGVLAGLFVTCVGYLSVRIDRFEDRLTQRFERLEERYVRHLEQHAGH